MKTYALSNAQKRIWYEQKKNKGSSLFNIGGTVQLKGSIDIDILKKALKHTVDCQDGMKYEFYEENNSVRQYISERECNVAYHDFSLLSEEENFHQWCERQARTVFTMVRTPLYECTVYKLSEKDYGYFVKMHHIIADGWSMKLFTDEVARTYEAYMEGRNDAGSNTAYYINYILEEDAYIHSKKGIRDENFWVNMFKPLPEYTSLSSHRLEGKRKIYELDESLMEKIEKYMRSQKITLNVFFVSIYLLYAYKKSGMNDLCVGIPLLGRESKRERETFGNFTNTMPYRYIVNEELTISEMIQQVRMDLKKVYRHQKYPYNKLCEALSVHENGLDRMYDICINYYNTNLVTSFYGVEAKNTEFYNGQQGYAMQIILRHWNNIKLQLDFDYQTDVYSKDRIADMYFRMNLLIKKIIKDDSIKVKEINLLTDSEYDKMIYQFNDTHKAFPFHITWVDLFCQMVKKHPNRIAVSSGNHEISYIELHKISDDIFYFLNSCGLKSGMIVAVIPNHDIESIMIILAVMKLGAVYLPIDSSIPEARKRQLLDESKTKYLIAEENIAGFKGKFLPLYDNQREKRENKNTKIKPPYPSDIAYLIYTSGSTGVPKGVMINHRNLMNYLCWAKNTYLKKEKEVFALYSSFSFDFTITSLFLPLISGGQIRLFPNKSNRNVFQAILSDEKVTIVKITPSHIPLIESVSVVNSNVHTFIIGGENLKTNACKTLDEKLGGKATIYNEYGPTETTVGCMIYKYEEAKGESVSIGRPIANTQIYLLDKDMQPVSQHTLGEIYIGGDSVSHGYYKREDETNKRFLKNRFLSNGRLYKSGDLAYYNEYDEVFYFGRNDDELKIRGNRINLSEIEKVIRTSGMVNDVLVKPVKREGNIQLCAYLLVENFCEKELREYLREQLPSYMLPDFYIRLKQIPLTLNGKTDISRLPSPKSINEEDNEMDGDKSEKYFKELETLLSIATDILSVEGDDNISADSNFYMLGGDSIKAIQISSKLYELGYELQVKDILRNPSFKTMIKFVKNSRNHVPSKGICSGEIAKLPIVEWFFNQKFKEEGHYNQSLLLSLKKDIEVKFLNNAFLYLIRHHDSLRLNYDRNENKLYYNNANLDDHEVVKEIVIEKEETDILEIIKRRCDPLFDITRDLLIRIHFIRTPRRRYLLITAHHLVMDAVSFRILLDDLYKLISTRNNDFTLPQKTVSYQDYCDAYYARAKAQKNPIKTWDINAILSTKKNIMTPQSSMKILEFYLKEEDTKKLNGPVNNAYNTKTNEMLLIVLADTLMRTLQCNQILIDSEGHGRDILDMNVNRTVGWFTTIHPIIISASGTTLEERIIALKKQIRKSDEKNEKIKMMEYDNALISFNYLGDYREEKNQIFSIDNFLWDRNVSPLNAIPYPIDINAVIIKQKLYVRIRYSKEILNEKLAEELYNNLRNNIKDTMCHCLNRSDKKISSSDFDMVNLTEKELQYLLKSD